LIYCESIKSVELVFIGAFSAYNGFIYAIPYSPLSNKQRKRDSILALTEQSNCGVRKFLGSPCSMDVIYI
jgi:hypothetical protein